ncbi:MAG: uroporphyrinogen decarboxylase family protein [Rikenellaceae bacterium]|jgi:uroporphyrinogen decarboxylase|nr:uroporphyrinogen decarboxylase family protein [Rikenellaceae bacterium]
MDMKRWMQGIIAGKERVAIPVLTHPGIEMLGKTVLEAVTDGRIHADAIEAVSRRWPSAAATVIMDLTVEAEAFGAEIRFEPNEVPTVVGHLIDGPEGVDCLKVPALDRARVPQYLLANRLSVERITDKPVLAGCIGPFSLAGRLYDMTEFMMLCYTDPDVAHKLLAKCNDFLRNYVVALKETGVQGVVVAEPAAGLMPGEGCEEFSSRYVKALVEAVQDDTFLVILHNCGNTGACTEAMVATGAAGYHFGNRMNMVDALTACPPDVLVMGNLDPVSVFKQATPEGVAQAATDLLEQTAVWPGFVLSSGCDVPPHVAEANIDAFYGALAGYNAKK